jgi:hypothetical protein
MVTITLVTLDEICFLVNFERIALVILHDALSLLKDHIVVLNNRC